jgi:uncharacterized protein
MNFLETAGPIAESEWIRFHQSPIHGLGGFARRAIPARTRVIEYLGERITKLESIAHCQNGNESIFALNDEHDLNGNVAWNPARYLNHSCAPNCEVQPENGQIWVMSIQDIGAGEEITFDYGYDLEDYREHPCGCGSVDCAGFIVAEEFRKYVRRPEKIAPARV